jgi:L-lactate dehydrogenase complex protein LldG
LTGTDQVGAARAATLQAIRKQLAVSAPHDAVHEKPLYLGVRHGDDISDIAWQENKSKSGAVPPAEMFRERLESVGGHCIIVSGEFGAMQAFERIIADLEATPLRARRIALSDAPIVERVIREAEIKADEIATCPTASDLFGFDVGVTSAQAAIAETGTLVLESERERHRVVSLLPPVHIAIINASDICLTLGDALAHVRRIGVSDFSPTITFVTGPSRTADIELTLAIGVHGPKELYVIIIE